jgi:hypothetical protein
MATLKKYCILYLLFICPHLLQGQNKGFEEIKEVGLKTTIEFIASDKMKGRKTGDEENNITARFLASKAASLGLKPLDEKGTYLQSYQLTRTSLFKDSTWLDLDQNGRKILLYSPSLIVAPLPESDLTIEAPVVFVGYGINSPEDDYYDLKKIDAKDKILMVLDRAPTTADGKKGLLKDERWMTSANLDAKFLNLLSCRPKAILLVIDPKSGHKDIDEVIPDAVKDLSEEFTLTGIRNLSDLYRNSLPRVIIITPAMADSILKPANINLKTLQEEIDSELKPHSMEIPFTLLSLHIQVRQEQINAFNVAGIFIGNEPDGKKDAIIYTAHFDHIGLDAKGKPNNGADDNASGTAALIEIAKAFKPYREKIKRSIIFLWTSGEELGLMGSKYYTEKPLYPLSNTIADINLDMIGRSWTPEDTGIVRGEQLDVKRGDSVYVSGGRTCKELLRLNENSAKQLNMQIDYAYNSPADPKRMYYRSDHYSFAQKRIPAIFYTTGLHRDYHSTGDIPSKLDYNKMVKVTKLAFLLGYQLVTQEKRLENNNY